MDAVNPTVRPRDTLKINHSWTKRKKTLESDGMKATNFTIRHTTTNSSIKQQQLQQQQYSNKLQNSSIAAAASSSSSTRQVRKQRQQHWCMHIKLTSQLIIRHLKHQHRTYSYTAGKKTEEIPHTKNTIILNSNHGQRGQRDSNLPVHLLRFLSDNLSDLYVSIRTNRR